MKINNAIGMAQIDGVIASTVTMMVEMFTGEDGDRKSATMRRAQHPCRHGNAGDLSPAFPYNITM